MGIFKEEQVNKENKERKNMFLLVLIIIFGVLGIIYSFYGKYENYKTIENIKKESIKKIEKKYNNEGKEVGNVSSLLTKEGKIKEVLKKDGTLENIDVIEKNEDSELNDEIFENLFSSSVDTKSISENKTKEDEIKNQMLQGIDNRKKAFLFKGSFCMVGSWDLEKKEFFNTFNWENLHLVKEWTNKLDVKKIEYKMFCFKDVIIKNNLYEHYMKKKKKNGDNLDLTIKILNHLGKTSSGVYKISFEKGYGSPELLSYNGCLMKGKKGMKILNELGIVFGNNDKQEYIKNGIIKSDCSFEKIDNILYMKKNIMVDNYYKNLFQTHNIFTKNKGTGMYLRWYGSLTYKEGIIKFLQYLNTEGFYVKKKVGFEENMGDVEEKIENMNYYFDKSKEKKFIDLITDMSIVLNNENLDQYLIE